MSVRTRSDSSKFALLLELSRAFSSKLDLNELLDLVLTRTKEVLNAEGVAILLVSEDGKEFHFPVARGALPEVEESLQKTRFPIEQGIAGAVLRDGKSVLITDVSDDERFYAGVDQNTGTQTRDLICVPLRSEKAVIGVAEVVNCIDGTFDEQDLDFWDALSGSLAIALENAQTYTKLRSSEQRLEREVAGLKRERVHNERFSEIVGNSAATKRVLDLVESAIPSPISVLVEGETGVGKELIARAIHYNGPRKEAPFITVNCGAMPGELLESELFGSKKGSFTGSTSDRMGLFEAANGGTIFLDEIGETTPAMQVKLLRALQEGEIRRVGETTPRSVDVRVVSATNRDLLEEIEEKRFRQDLYYRIAVFPIKVPALRDRREDVPQLAAHLLHKATARLGKSVRGISPEAMEKLAGYSWPGNVRELENELERAVALAQENDLIFLPQLSEKVVAPNDVSVSVPKGDGKLRDVRQAFEREYISGVLQQYGGNATKAAAALGITRQMLQRKIKAYGLREI